MTEVIRRLGVEPPRPARVREHPRAPWLAVAAVCVGAFLGQLDASIVTVAVPDLHRDLHVSVSAASWVSLAYLLVLVGTVSAAGRVADVAGRKLLYTYGFAVFTAASLGCGLAPNLPVLLAMRVVQGVGAAMLQANSVALIRTTTGGRRLGRAIGLQGAAQAVGLAVGPAVGGVLVGVGGWRWVFYVNVPVGVAGVVLAWLLLPRTRERAGPAPFDWLGLALLLPGSAALLLALSLLGRDGASAPVGVLVGVAVGLLAGFVGVERRRRRPLVDLATVRSRAAALGSGLLAYLVLFGVLFVTPLYLAGRGLTPGRSGLVLAALPVALGVVAPLAGRFGPRAPVLGLALTGGGCAVLAAAHSTPMLVGMLTLAGAGLGLFLPANNATIAGAGRAEHAGMVSGVLNMTRGLGTSLGVGVAGATYLLGSFTATLTVLAVLAALAALLAASRRDR